MVLGLLTAGGVALAAGDLDRTFGGDGRVSTRIGHSGSLGDLVAQPDGKLVAVGDTSDAGYSTDFSLARYNPNGSLDKGFGNGGKVVTDLGSPDDYASALVL